MKKYKVPIVVIATFALLPFTGKSQDHLKIEAPPKDGCLLLGYNNDSKFWNLKFCTEDELPTKYESYFIWSEAIELFKSEKNSQTIITKKAKSFDGNVSETAEIIRGTFIDGSSTIKDVANVRYTIKKHDNNESAIESSISSSITYHIWYKESTNEVILVCKETRFIKAGLFNSKTQYVGPTHLTQDVPNNAIKCFPNPAVDNINISYSLTNTSPASAVITDLAGRNIEHHDLGYKSPGSHNSSLNLSELPFGTYLLTIVTNEYIESQKITINYK